MTDTCAEVERRYRRLLLERPGEERVKMGCSMRAMARALIIASVRERDARASPAILRRAIFLRFYGSEFDPATRERITAWLMQHADDTTLQ